MRSNSSPDIFSFSISGLACNFICAEVGEAKPMLFTILTTAKEYEDIDDLLDLVEENISFQ